MTAFLLVPSPAGAIDRDNRCLKYADRYTVAEQTRFGVIFHKPVGQETPRFQLYYGCIFSAERARRLPGQDPAGPPVASVSVLTLEGRYAIYGVSRDEAAGQVIVYDVKAGVTSFNHHAGTDPASEAQARSIVGNARGSTAWISEEPGDPPARAVHVWSTFEETERRVPDRGPGIEPESLAITGDGTTLYWRNAGQPRSSPID